MTADTVGGVFTYTVELARQLRHHRILLVTMGAAMNETQRDALERLPHVEVIETRYRLEWMADPWDDVTRAGVLLLELEAEHRPDVVHLNGYVHGALPWRTPVLIVGHSCVLSWWQAVKGEAAPKEWSHYREQVTVGLRHADRIIAPSAAMLAALRRHYGTLPYAGVIPNGRTDAHLKPGRKCAFYLTAGRLWDEGKNVRLLASIAEKLPWPVYAAGDGTLHETPNFSSLGLLSPRELSAWLACASIYAFPALYEPFGLSVLEAARCGCALVLGDIPSLRENWEDAAVFCDPHDAGAWLPALASLARDPQRLAKLQGAALERSRRFTAEAMGQRYLALYDDLLGGRSACAS